MIADGGNVPVEDGEDVDSGYFAKTLVAEMKKLIDDTPVFYSKVWDLPLALRNYIIKTNTVKGASTVVMAKLDDTLFNSLRTTILGDSGFIILRPSITDNSTKLEMEYRSK